MSKTRCYFHIVFGTKYRNKAIDLDRRERLYTYISKIIENKKSRLIKINGIQDHIHVLVDLHPSIALSDLVKSIKQSTSKRISETHYLPLFEGWASEYYASSVSPSHVEAVKEYIEKQTEHHLEKGYELEIREFVTKMGLELYNDEP